MNSQATKRGADFSELLRAQLWRGERLRVTAALALLVTLAVVVLARDLFAGRYELISSGIGLATLGAMVAVESIWFLILRRVRRGSGTLMGALVAAGTVIEANFPTIGIVLMTANPAVGPYRALATPMVTLYFLFIILSALRVRPGICILSGLAASGGYLAITLATHAMFPPPPSALPQGLWFSMTAAMMMLLAGLLSAVVSRQVLLSASHAIEASLSRQKLEADMTVAAEIQRNLLPERSPRAQGFDVAGRSIPAGQTGGDSFDWLTLEDGRTVVTLADVTGHGIGPALLAANLHAYVHAIFTSPGGAGEWVARLNQSIGASLSEGRFVTFATAVLHPPTAAVELLSAGHGPILLYRAAQGEVSELTAHGVPLGVLAEAAFDEPTRLQMGRGDVLVLITDGFVEQVNAAGEQYGSDRLKDSLLRWASRDSGEIIAALYADVQAFAAAVPQADDLTVTVIRRTN